MDFIYNKTFLEHKAKTQHPECPERLEYFDKNLTQTEISSDTKNIELLYSKEYIEQVKQHSKNEQSFDADTYTNKHSFKAACVAANAAILASEQNDFSLARPPGHHANAIKPMGFCLFNNIAVATQKLVKQSKKVLIIDFDGHHGNGTQDIFYDSDQVLFLSTHQFPAYPGSGWIEDIGEKKGKGFTINIPLPPYSTDDLFLQSIEEFLPIIKDQFKPDIVAISAGFDAHHKDQLLNLEFTTNAFYKAGELISKYFQNVFATLEGGYNLEHIHENILDFTNGMNKKSQQFKTVSSRADPDVQNDFKTRIMLLKEILKPYWSI